MNAGTPPEPGQSRMTITTYRVTREGHRSSGTTTRVYAAAGTPYSIPDSLTWPPCRCHLCRSRRAR
ncbi:hypothetical protein SUDANB145_04300 [Streptomyces sp. enrichment culture]|uniref:hypothetical protein n=1 Tax=Streptomyces sp. ISL-12 TaxID=2819177 RepID=UPI001BE7F820|nr:hypothetical protein [Streptomyces sp. ISL-12]MBT2410486.1 hypothetical protein [Streptomyces sp. ISL-12]